MEGLRTSPSTSYKCNLPCDWPIAAASTNESGHGNICIAILLQFDFRSVERYNDTGSCMWHRLWWHQCIWTCASYVNTCRAWMRVAIRCHDCDRTVDARLARITPASLLASCRFYLVEIFFVNCKSFTTPAIFRRNPRWKTDGSRYVRASTSYLCHVLHVHRFLQTDLGPGTCHCLDSYTMSIHNTVQSVVGYMGVRRGGAGGTDSG